MSQPQFMSGRMIRRIQNAQAALAAIPFGFTLLAIIVMLSYGQSFERMFVVAGIVLFGGIALAVQHIRETRADPQAHIFVRHENSREWAYYPPGEHPVIPFEGWGIAFSVIPFDYEWHDETQDIQLFEEGRATVKLSWRPDVRDLREWIESNRKERIEKLRGAAIRDAKYSFGLLVKGLKRDDRERIIEKPLPLVEEHLGVGRGIELKDYTLVITQFPEPQPAPPPQEPWEGYGSDVIHIGDHKGKPVFLDDEDQIAHIQIIGASRFGKSKLVEYAMRQRFGYESVIVIDPNQQLYDDFLTWCAHREEYVDTHFLDPSDEGSAVGFNPFRLEGKRTSDRISARANRLQATTLKALGTPGDAIQAQRIIKCLYYVLIEQDLPVTDLNAFMVPRLFDRRDEIMAACQSQDIRDQWEMLTAEKGTAAYVNMMQSSANRLFDIIAERGVQRIFTNPKPINLREITAEGHALFVNLGKSDIFPLAARNVIGAFLVDEIWDIMSSRTKKQLEDLAHVNLVIDEFHNFATPEFATMLKEGGKYGLHLWLINHSLEDLDRTVRGSLNACHTRIAFGGTAQKDATAVMEGSRPAQGNDLRDEISRIPSLDKRVFMLRRTGKPNLLCTTPWVEERDVDEETKQSYLDYLTRMPEIEVAPILTEESETETPNPNSILAPQPSREVDSDDFYH